MFRSKLVVFGFAVISMLSDDFYMRVNELFLRLPNDFGKSIFSIADVATLLISLIIIE